jgi:hypothetical protein
MIGAQYEYEIICIEWLQVQPYPKKDAIAKSDFFGIGEI